MVIYCTTNLVNGRRYIGLDSKNNPNYLGSGKAFKLALAKYGKNNFRKDILTHCKDIETLLEKEKFYILRLNAVNSKIYYNIAEGGGIIITRAVCQYSRSGKLLKCWNTISEVENELGFNNSKITAVAKGNYGRRTAYGYVWRYKEDDFNKYPVIPQNKVYQHQKIALSKRMTGKGNPMYGKNGINSNRYSTVNQYDLKGNFIKTWNTITEATLELKINNISACCRNQRDKAGGYKWKYFKDIVRSS